MFFEKLEMRGETIKHDNKSFFFHKRYATNYSSVSGILKKRCRLRSQQAFFVFFYLYFTGSGKQLLKKIVLQNFTNKLNSRIVRRHFLLFICLNLFCLRKASATLLKTTFVTKLRMVNLWNLTLVRRLCP
jgi:hypothetical protein